MHIVIQSMEMSMNVIQKVKKLKKPIITGRNESE